MNPSVNTFLFLALACEAKPLIAHFGLKKLTSYHVFECYQHDNILLTITGVGKNAMATAVGYSLGMFNIAPMPLCINIGIAGHQKAPVGSLFVADKITDHDNGKHFYPQLIFSNQSCPSMNLHTVSTPQAVYAPNTLYDMEASAFYEAASRFTSSELILSLKVVSDNAQSSINLINAKQVSAWIAEHNHTLMALITLMQQKTLPVSTIAIDVFEVCHKHLHLSVSEKIQLKALINRWLIMSTDSALPFTITDIKSTRELLVTLKQHIENLPVYL